MEPSEPSGGAGVMSIDELPDDVDYSMAAEASSRAAAQHREVMRALDERVAARSMAVPTNDKQVRLRLRELGEPITQFGEREVDRRERLRSVLTNIRMRAEEEGEDVGGDVVKSESEDSEEDQEEEFYTEGSSELLDARRRIASFSLARAKKRIASQRQQAQISLRSVVQRRKAIFEPLKTLTNLGSQIGDERPISVVRFSPDSKSLLTASWSGMIRRWNVPSATSISSFRAHTEKVGGLAWHPAATLLQSESAVNFVSGGGEGKVCLWSLDKDKPLRTLEGHAARVCRTTFHPSGNYVASASYDGTWRLWDVENGKELLLQEGHSKEVYAVEFQEDGALIASGGLDAIGRVWDVRTGRTAMVLAGHAKEILSIDFSPNGYQCATASGDDTVRIWDMRALKTIYTIPAHKSSVSDVRFFRAAEERRQLLGFGLFNGAAPRESKNGGEGAMDVDLSSAPLNGTSSANEEPQLTLSGLYLATAGYDGFLKVWSADDWQLMRSLSGDAGKVMSVDISSGEERYFGLPLLRLETRA
ncbi:RNA processing-related protein [Tilletiaria anomala UBC 951]|uniref:RNA processing-related protein n=1 Tax=Tilletiaria anomala (strain ATCC 24038 / CBS 436.72 / UBC 951) TaxID=1037660 RepID=A0A066W410_TILAU|nr:RNA processing-related protein [Tilletiaria anomala UBC 951]KDN48451.1 RNA processing-related protein [Tilletiaria anomala UBC 951]